MAQGDVCEHGIRWPWDCSDCNEKAEKEQYATKIAATLTAAQQERVLFNRPDGGPRYGWRGSGSASCALRRKGLLRERQDDIGNLMWSLTPLGLAVRCVLAGVHDHPPRTRR